MVEQLQQSLYSFTYIYVEKKVIRSLLTFLDTHSSAGFLFFLYFILLYHLNIIFFIYFYNFFILFLWREEITLFFLMWVESYNSSLVVKRYFSIENMQKTCCSNKILLWLFTYEEEENRVLVGGALTPKMSYSCRWNKYTKNKRVYVGV